MPAKLPLKPPSMSSTTSSVSPIKCEVCSARAIMALYARNPGSAQPTAERGDNPFYPHTEADLVLNLCVDCFHATAQELREANYVAIRGTGVIHK
jgi:hypothetical protein